MSTIRKSTTILKDAVPIAFDSSTNMYYSIGEEEDATKQITSVHQITPSHLETIPFLDLTNPKIIQRSGVFISAPSGAGKSSIAVNLAKQYLKILKNKKVPPKIVYDEVKKRSIATKRNRRVLLFTQATELDPAFMEEFGQSEFFHFICINGSDEGYMNMKVSDLSNSIVIFDDFIGMSKIIEVFTLTFIKNILEHSRKQDTQVIIISHQTQEYQKTKSIIFECDTYILAPFASQNSCRKFLESYGDVSKEQIATMIANSNRRFEFLIYHKSYPRYFQSKRNITLLN